MTAALRWRCGSIPAIESRPSVGGSNPIQPRMSVDLPDPFGPTSAVMLPSGTARSRPRSAHGRPR